ncbi:MAG: hypothetical protein ACKVOX_08375 [Rhizobacter sp.]
MTALRWVLMCWMTACIAVSSSGALAEAADKGADKALRRLQLQMQGLQQQVQDAQAAKTKVEADKAVVDKQLLEQAQQVARLKGALRKANDSLKASEAARVELTATVASLEKQMAEQKRSFEETLAQKARELVQYTKVRDEQQAQLQRRHDDQVTLVGECTVKNDKLIHLGVELIDRYRGKTVADVLSQREPVLGIGDVQMFNLVQDYRDRADAERFTAPAPDANPSSPPPPINR